LVLVMLCVAVSVRPESQSTARQNSLDDGDELFQPAVTSAAGAAIEGDDGSGRQDVLIDLVDASTPTNGSNRTVHWSEKWPYFDTGCMQWLPINHVYFQLANSFLLLSYFAPAGLYGLLYLRLMLAIGCFFFALWGWVVLCAFDTFLWNAFFTLINIVHGIVVLFSLRPVRFDKQVEEVYKCIFQPLKVSKQQFKKVVNCMKSIRPLKKGEFFAVEKQTRVETLSLLLSGRMLVMENGQTLHVLSPMQFLDSPEWFGVASEDIFTVSIRASDESRVLLWHRDKLKLILLSDAFLQAVFDHILGRDVVRKLTQMKEQINDSGKLRSNMILGSSHESHESKSPSHVVAHSGAPAAAAGTAEKYLLLDEERSKYAAAGDPYRPGRNEPLESSGVAAAAASASYYDYSMVPSLGSTDI